MKSILFFLAFQVICFASAPALADSPAPETQQQMGYAESPSESTIASDSPVNRGFFSRLAEGFQNLVRFFRGEGDRAQEKADQYQEQADMYASDVAKQPEQSWLSLTLQRLAGLYNKAASLWRAKADTDHRRADSYQERADHYEKLAGDEGASKERKMAKCFSDLTGAYEEKKKISLIEEGAEGVACSSPVFSSSYSNGASFGPGIWWTQESDARCFAVDENKRQARVQEIRNLPIPPQGSAPLTEAEKQARLDACHSKLNDALDEAMGSCLGKSGNVLANLETQRFLERGVDYDSIYCSSRGYTISANYTVWNTLVKTLVGCHIRRNGIARPVPILIDAWYRNPSPPAAEKQNKLRKCVELFAENSNRLREKRIGSAPPHVKECLKDKALTVDNRQKELLRVQGEEGPYRCVSPENYFITYTGNMATAHGVGNCEGGPEKGLIPDDPLSVRRSYRTVQCPLQSADAELPVEIANESWDACIKRSMREAKKALLQGRAAGTYTCSGLYGSERGWSVTCSSGNGLEEFTTGYQPYPAVCNSLPGTAFASYPRGNAGFGSGSE